jgi:hypothetical protein
MRTHLAHPATTASIGAGLLLAVATLVAGWSGLLALLWAVWLGLCAIALTQGRGRA